jgi:hypothetical protein
VTISAMACSFSAVLDASRLCGSLSSQARYWFCSATDLDELLAIDPPRGYGRD